MCQKGGTLPLNVCELKCATVQGGDETTDESSGSDFGE